MKGIYQLVICLWLFSAASCFGEESVPGGSFFLLRDGHSAVGTVRKQYEIELSERQLLEMESPAPQDEDLEPVSPDRDETEIDSDKAKDLSERQKQKLYECQMVNSAMLAVGKTKNRDLQVYVASVGKKLVAVAEAGEQMFSFDVLVTPQIQAATNSCGNIYISTGLMIHLNSEGQLAAVLGHEIAHVLKRHYDRGKMRGTLKNTLSRVAGMALGRSSYVENQIARAAQTGADLALTKYDQEQEFEADSLGAEILKRAGYPPLSVVEVMSIFKGLESLNLKKAMSENRLESLYRNFITSHPPTPERYERAVREINSFFG